jgi:hypothetical protein
VTYHVYAIPITPGTSLSDFVHSCLINNVASIRHSRMPSDKSLVIWHILVQEGSCKNIELHLLPYMLSSRHGAFQSAQGGRHRSWIAPATFLVLSPCSTCEMFTPLQQHPPLNQLRSSNQHPCIRLFPPSHPPYSSNLKYQTKSPLALPHHPTHSSKIRIFTYLPLLQPPISRARRRRRRSARHLWLMCLDILLRQARTNLLVRFEMRFLAVPIAI